ncbi:ferritin-like domain-containing protein [Nannocystis radixulma]|uniref:Ferritin-like domain-containing protein n=1 Tax=Nannocystis radixulma TaxID=2995305 RepID=A0ABT5BFK0_9BACT|nr:ferritin-like domain-containing protein [Nannocystis radixulma]MDC0672498.1 ferritin-like domain-containing protein [Nannocystis radixulma]
MLSASHLDLRAEAQQRRPAIAVPQALAPAVVGTWRARMVNEHGSSHVFAQLADQLAALGWASDAAEANSFAAEEREHGRLCGAVVEAAGGEARAPCAAPSVLPAHADTTPRAAALRNVISICCLSETVAVALIGAERLEMPDGPLRELLSQILGDEVGHARFGWRLLAREAGALTPAERAALAIYLPLAFAHLEAHELAHLPVGASWPEDAAQYGLCAGADARALFFDTVDQVIIPGLEAHGLPAADAWKARHA